jgi:hypothetical protein
MPLMGLAHEFSIPLTSSLMDEDHEFARAVLEAGLKYLAELNRRVRADVEFGGEGLHDEKAIIDFLAKEGGVA